MAKVKQSSGGASVFVHCSQHPAAVQRELLRSFKRCEINHKFHYESHKQAAKWLAVHEAHSPARTDRDCLATYDRAFRVTAERQGQGAVQVVGLGCGGGQKDVRLLTLLRQAGARSTYVPCDVSLPLVLVAASAASRVLAPSGIHPIVCDLAMANDLPGALPPAAGKRLITFFGMIPNFEPRLILPRLRDLVRAEDRLLFSANLVPDDSDEALRRILPQYDNPLTLDWLMTLLHDAGVSSDDGVASFGIERTAGSMPLPRFVARFKFRRASQLRIAGEQIGFRKGDSIRLFFSVRYTPQSLTRWLAKNGLAVVDQWITASREEGVFLCQRRQ